MFQFEVIAVPVHLKNHWIEVVSTSITHCFMLLYSVYLKVLDVG